MTLIQQLQTHASNENIFYIEELADIIIEERINTIQELEEYEKSYNKLNDKASIEEAVNFWIDIIDNDPYEYDDVTYDQLEEMKKERKLMNNTSIENKIFHIIKYYHLTERDNPFPYFTYQLIIQNKL